MVSGASLFYFRTIYKMWFIVSIVMLLYLVLMQYVIAPNVPYTQVCNGFIRDQDLIMSLEGRSITLKGGTLYVHEIACSPH